MKLIPPDRMTESPVARAVPDGVAASRGRFSNALRSLASASKAARVFCAAGRYATPLGLNRSEPGWQTKHNLGG